ncbi:MAG: acetate/propionate family kinase [Pseudomonadota bacterium]
MNAILTLNSGSSSLKFSLYEQLAEPRMVLNGQVEGLGSKPRLIIRRGSHVTDRAFDGNTQSEALSGALQALSDNFDDLEVTGVGHRIVHGGQKFYKPQPLTDDVVVELETLNPLAPLHQPHNLAGVVAARSAFPDALQVGCFDTAFHRNHPWVNDTFALPREYYDEGVRRYGFHGLSYEYVTGEIAKTHADLYPKRLVIAHLGNGASMCAVDQGTSVGSTMGFSVLDGLPMGTRCGQIDPGVVLYLIEQKKMQPHEVTELLYRRSGLLGLSGISSDMRSLENSDRPEAAQAIDYYVFRARREIGALSAVMGGIDGLVFCGGIGENSPAVRARILEKLDYLGLSIDESANGNNETHIGADAKKPVLVIPTDEERVIARAVFQALQP